MIVWSLSCLSCLFKNHIFSFSVCFRMAACQWRAKSIRSFPPTSTASRFRTTRSKLSNFWTQLLEFVRKTIFPRWSISFTLEPFPFAAQSQTFFSSSHLWSTHFCRNWEVQLSEKSQWFSSLLYSQHIW